MQHIDNCWSQIIVLNRVAQFGKNILLRLLLNEIAMESQFVME